MRALARRLLQHQLGRAGIRVPGLAQVIGKATHVRAVARTHQALGVRCGFAGMEASTAGGVVGGQATGTGIGGRSAHAVIVAGLHGLIHARHRSVAAGQAYAVAPPP
ncbi:hypothetical protein G6F50_014372 [Rhizopus delemar]|uniref:Uncharacterized protein n=1 Tax=Rhizopus delemar TaxID=936053 RepID=A0A9P6Y6A1_9FUNG|nr:hypothetical protein G6F50_014372 [Rhizopus delemar]